MDIRQIRKNIQDYVTWRKVHNIFKIGKLDDGRDIYGVNGNNNQLFGVAIVSCTNEIEVVL